MIELLFIGLLVVAIITGNKTVGISAAIVLALRLLRITPALELFSAKGINRVIIFSIWWFALWCRRSAIRCAIPIYIYRVIISSTW